MKGGDTMKKIFPIIAGLTLLGGATVYGVTQANAAGVPNDTSIIEKIASKFNLNKDEVKAVFDQEHTERQATMQKNFEERLTTAVTNGKITEAQKQAILAKAKEMKSAHEDLNGLSDEEREAKMKAKKDDLQKWATEQGLTADQLKGLLPFGHGPGFRHDMKAGASATQNTQN